MWKIANTLRQGTFRDGALHTARCAEDVENQPPQGGVHISVNTAIGLGTKWQVNP